MKMKGFTAEFDRARRVEKKSTTYGKRRSEKTDRKPITVYGAKQRKNAPAMVKENILESYLPHDVSTVG